MNILILLMTKRNAAKTLSFLSLLLMYSQVFAYCSSSGNNTNYEWIESVDIGTFSNTSGSDYGYSDYTQQAIDVAPGAVDITLVPGFRSSSYNEYWRVWIDFNQDDEFQATEQVYSGTSSSTLTGSIVIPNDVLSGETRMRVSMKYAGAPTSCGSFTYGEVEDYLIALDIVDSSSPTIIATTPIDLASEVGFNTNVVVTFSEEIDPLSVNQNTILVADQGAAIAGNVSSNEAVLTFVPSVSLSASTDYSVVVTGVADLAGNPLLSDGTWSFTTQAPDLTAPTITLMSPDAGDADVSVNALVQVTFSEAMDSQTFNASTFSISDGLSNVPGSINITGNIAQFNATSPLNNATDYTVTLGDSLSDLNGNTLDQEFNFDFTTRAFEPDYCSALGQNVAYFWVDSVRIGNLKTSFQSSSFYGYRDSSFTTFDLSRFYNSLELTTGYSGSQFPVFWNVFIDFNQDGDFSNDEGVFDGNASDMLNGGFSVPDGALGGNTRMRVMMKYGSPATPCEFFSYGQVVDFGVSIPELVEDSIAPSIESISPADNVFDVGLSSDITIQFSEEMNAQTINSQNVSLSVSGVALGANYELNDQGTVLTINPYVPFDESTNYVVELGIGLEDLAGNSLQNSVLSSFTTVAGASDAFTLSGSVSAFGTPLQGISINVVGNTSPSAISSNVGTFSFDSLSIGSYTVSASKPGYTFTPEFIGQADSEPFSNGDFETGDFSGFTLYETNNGHTVTSVLISNASSNGVSSYVAQIASGVGGVNDLGTPGGGGLYQTIDLQAGDLTIDMDIASIANNGNGDGGMIEVFFDGESLGSYDFGSLSPAVKKYSSFSFNLANVSQGAHELRIQSTREYLTGPVYHQIDNISLSGTSVAE